MKKFTAILVVLVIILSVALYVTHTNYKQLQSHVDTQFESRLGHLLLGMAVNLEDPSTDFHELFMRKSNDAYAVSVLYNITSYAQKQDMDLDWLIFVMRDICTVEDWLRALTADQFALNLSLFSFGTNPQSVERRELIYAQLREFYAKHSS